MTTNTVRETIGAKMYDSLYAGFNIASSIGSMIGGSAIAFRDAGYKILEIGKISGIRAQQGYPGVRYRTPNGQIKSIEIHPAHQGHGIHLQKNIWWLNKKGYIGQYYRAYGKHFEIFRFWNGWF